MGKAKAKAGETSKKRLVKAKKFTENELKALELVALHPEKSNHAISKEMVGLGLVKDNKYLQLRVARSIPIRDKIHQLQEKGQLRFTKLLPKAAKKLDGYLKGDKTPLKAIDIAAKYGLGRSDDAPVRVDTINIDTLNVLQSNQLSTITQRLDELEPDE